MTPVRQFLVPVVTTMLILWAALSLDDRPAVIWVVIGGLLGLMWEAAMTSWAKVRAERKEGQPPMP